MAKILIIDDDKMLCETLTDMLTQQNHNVSSAYTISEAKMMCESGQFDVIFLDVQLPDGDGLTLIPELKTTDSKPEVIIMTGQGDPDGAEIAIKNGAWCYLEKPYITRDLFLPLTRALQYRAEKQHKASPGILFRNEIIGNSPQLQKSLELLATATCSDLNVLITGDTGTGKEVFAHTIHQNSSRAVDGNFVVVDCAALPETLVESILFGHIKGAFTGAERPRKGLVRQANGGTLFLDEVGELPMHVQRSFLRVLQEHRFRPIGSSVEEESDFRLIAATNKDLEELVKDGKFRKDLLYRLQSLVVYLPALKDRGDDILELANYFMAKLSLRYKVERKEFSPEFIEAINAYSWPGNVRELFQALDRVFATAFDSTIYYAQHLPEAIRVESAKSGIRKTEPPPTPTDGKPENISRLSGWKQYKADVEYDYLQRLLSATNNNIANACRISGLSRARLYQLINKHDLQKTHT